MTRSSAMSGSAPSATSAITRRRDAAGARPPACGCTEPVGAGDDQIERRPQDRRADRHDVVRARRQTQKVELGPDLKVVIEDEAAQIREVEVAVTGHTFVQPLLR